MLNIYLPGQKKIIEARNDLAALTENPLWIEMIEPTLEEEKAVEQLLSIDVPTKEDMKALELSNRLYREGESLFMTATIVSGSETDAARILPVSFILTNDTLVTVRYHYPRAFDIFSRRAQQSLYGQVGAEMLLIELLETIVDRISDPLERMAVELDGLSHQIFLREANGKKPRKDFNALLAAIGQKADLNSKVKESLVSLERLSGFLALNTETVDDKKSVLNHLRTLEQDIRALNEHAVFLSNKINFLLEATLGMINIEQNAIIKFFSVAAVIFLPPTLIASVYGMNFDHMPELHMIYAYPVTLGAMVLSAVVPYLYFKGRGWL